VPNAGCTVCALDAKPRKLAESLLIAGLGVRDVADFIEWQSFKEQTQIKISKSALDRHRVNGHFVAEKTVDISSVTESEFKTLRDYASELFKAYQKANKGKVPSTKEVLDFLAADAKLADIEAHRNDERELAKLMKDMSYKKPMGENDEVPVQGTREGSESVGGGDPS